MKTGGKPVPKLTGWAVASTFPGFCSFHDKRLFAPLEDSPFVGSKEQCFLLAYRAVAWELYAKSASQANSALRHALAFKHPGLREFIDIFNFGVELGLLDARAHKEAFDLVLEKEDWSEIRGVLFEFNDVFPIQCTGAFFPQLDVDGNLIQEVDESPKRPEVICVMSFAAHGRSYACFVWLAKDEASCQAFAAALRRKSPDEIAPVLGALFLQSIENCHISPSWYDGLSDQGRQWCVQQMAIMGMVGHSEPPSAQARVQHFAGLRAVDTREI